MHESYEARLNRKHDFRVKYRFYRPDEGGRKTGPPYQGYRSDFSYEGFGIADFNVHMIWPEFENELGQVITEDKKPVSETGTARMWILRDDLRNYHKEKIKLGSKCFMMEANQKMGEYEVIEIVGLRAG